jgi:hypothetical protein
MINMQVLARRLNTLQKHGYRLVIISWLSRSRHYEYAQSIVSIMIQKRKSGNAFLFFVSGRRDSEKLLNI